MNIEIIRKCYAEVIQYIIDCSAGTYVSGRGYPIIKKLRSTEIGNSNTYTKDFLANLKSLGVIEIDYDSEKDYMYRWTFKLSEDEVVNELLKLVTIDSNFKKDDTIFIMYNNKIHEGKIVESTPESIIVAVNSEDGLRSMTLNSKGLKDLSASNSLEDLLEKLEFNIRQY